MKGLRSVVHVLISTAILFASPALLFAQSLKDKIEVRLNLLKRINYQGVAEDALGVSIINHLNKDIYIPNFRLFASYSGVHFYQKEGDKWAEIDIDSHDYIKLELIKSVDGTEWLVQVPEDVYQADDYQDRNNEYLIRSNLINKRLDSLVKAAYNSRPDHYGLSISGISLIEGPLFLRAHQTLDNITVRSLKYLSTKQMDYKIAFNSEKRDTLKYYKSPVVFVNHLAQYGHPKYPKIINGYELFYPEDIITNTIYFTPKHIIKE